MDSSVIKKYDKDGMIQIYEKWPEMAKNAFNSEYKILDIQGINHIIFAGMGGSGAIGDIFEAILSKTNIYVSVVKGYLLPKTITENTLIIITSVSGNTVETLTILENAKKSKAKVIVFSSGGKCEEFCKKSNTEYYKIQKIHSPRASFVTFLFSMLKVFQNIISLKIEDVNEAINELEKLKKKIASHNLTNTNPAIKLAENITNVPLIYYPHGLESAAIRFKNSLQENAKIHVISEDVVEASHNGIVAWEKKSIIEPILIEGKDDYKKTKERWSILKEYFISQNIKFNEVFANSDSILSKIVYLMYFLDFVSIYKAIMLKQNPTPVKSIDFIKSRLEE
jgi:glucose/mannose-6-phosphate isomerase